MICVCAVSVLSVPCIYQRRSLIRTKRFLNTVCTYKNSFWKARCLINIPLLCGWTEHLLVFRKKHLGPFVGLCNAVNSLQYVCVICVCVFQFFCMKWREALLMRTETLLYLLLCDSLISYALFNLHSDPNGSYMDHILRRTLFLWIWICKGSCGHLWVPLSINGNILS